MNAPHLHRLFCFAATLFALPLLASAQIVFTVQATANSTALGYTAGQSATFTFTLRDFGATPAVGSAPGDRYFWTEETLTQPEIFSSVSGTGLAGTWSRPSASGGAPFSELTVYNDNSFKLYAGSDVPPTGLTVNGSGVRVVTFYATYTGLTFSGFTNTLPNPVTYLSNYLGTYSASSTWNARVFDATFQNADFTVNSITIASAVPEPATYAVLAGAAALGLALWRRRSRPRAPLSSGA